MFKKLLRRSLIALMVPVIIIELMILYMSMQLSLLDEYRCYKINDISSVDVLYKEGEQNISFDYSGEIYKAGFDVVKEKNIEGSYYYSFHGNNIQLFVLTDKTAKDIASGKTVYIEARLIKDELTTSYIEGEYNEASLFGAQSYDGIVAPVIISEIDYPAFKVKAVHIMQLISVILLVISVIYTIAAFAYPVIYFGFSSKGLFDSRKEMIEVLGNELTNRLDHKDGFLYITEEYIINAFLSRIVVTKHNNEVTKKDDE